MKTLRARLTHAIVSGVMLFAGHLAHAAEPAGLTINNGVTVQFAEQPYDNRSLLGAGLYVNGRLTTQAGVVLTRQGDADPSLTYQRWLGVMLAPNLDPAAVSINGLEIRHAGGALPYYSGVQEFGAALSMSGGAYAFSGLRISQNTVGLRITGGAAAQIRQSRIEDNGTGIQVYGASLLIAQSSLARNYAIQTSYHPETPVQASNNWWGHATGPRVLYAQNTGLGSTIDPDVIYKPFLTADLGSAPGPELTATFNDQPVVDNMTITQPGALLMSAHSAAGVSSLEAYVDNSQVLSKTFTDPEPSTSANPTTANNTVYLDQYSNGAHTLLLIAKDPNGASTTLSVPFTLAISSPTKPVITSPANGAQVGNPVVGITGTASPYSLISTFVNGQRQDRSYSSQADAQGNFNDNVALPAEGTYNIAVQAANRRAETSPLSDAVTLTYSAPAPTLVFVSPADQAIVRGTVPVQVNAVSATAAKTVQLQVQQPNGTLQSLATLTQWPWVADWDTTQVPDGNYTLLATITDGNGKTGQASRVVQVEQVPPPPPAPVMPYGVQGLSVTPAVSFGDQPITITGQVVTQDAAAQIVPNASLRLVLRVQGFERRITLVADATGQFRFDFIPQTNDAGTYEVYVLHPDDALYASRPAPAQFTINRLSFDYSRYTVNAIRGIETPIELQATASEGTGATNVRWQALPADQPSGSLPPGITLDLGQPIDVPAGTSVPMTLRFTGSPTAGATGTIILKAFAQESGTRPRAELRLDYRLYEATPGLTPSPSLVEIGVKQETTASAAVTITNKGFAIARNVRAELIATKPGTPPALARLASSGDIGDLGLGQKTTVQISAAPAKDTADGYYEYELRISATNDAGGSVPVVIAVAQSGEGGARFKMVDIYTNTLDKNGNPIPGLAGATIKLQNEALTSNIYTLTSNEQGIAEIANLPPGNYRWRASAPGHTDNSGRIQVRAGLTANERVFMDSQLISIEFSVTETTIQDEYNITLEATYQTQVPAPVVLMEPMSINLPDMQVGEELTGEITLSNYGLVRADDLSFSLPQSDQNYRYEFFGELPKELAAKSRVVIPYKITAIAPFKNGLVLNKSSNLLPLAKGYNPSVDVQRAIQSLLEVGRSNAMPSQKAALVAKAASCSGYAASACASYTFTCAAGDKSGGAACSSVNRASGASCIGTGIGGYVPWYSNPSGGGGGWGGGWGGGSSLPLTPGCTPGCKCAGAPGAGTGGGSSGGSSGGGSSGSSGPPNECK